MKLTLFLLFFTIMGTSFAQNKSPIQGDQLIELLGMRKNSELVTKMNKYIGNKDVKEDISFLNYGKGIQINFERSLVKGMDFYNDKNPFSDEFKQFAGDLPYGISFENTIYQIKQKIGEGYEGEGELSSTYLLIKVFTLNDDDDYQLTIQFSEGRMILFSMTYIEGGSSDDEEKVNESGEKIFSGSDFFTMIKKNKYNLEFKKLLELIGKPDIKDKKRMLVLQDGVDVHFNQNGLIESIALYSGGQQSDYKGQKFGAYINKLPFGIKMPNSKTSIVKKAGNPIKTLGNTIVYREGFADMHITFNGNKIQKLKFVLANLEAGE